MHLPLPHTEPWRLFRRSVPLVGPPVWRPLHTPGVRGPSLDSLMQANPLHPPPTRDFPVSSNDPTTQYQIEQLLYTMAGGLPSSG